MNIRNSFTYGLAGFCLGLAQFMPEHNFLLIVIGAVAVGLFSKADTNSNSIRIKEECKTTYQMVKTLSVCQFVGVENINSNLKQRYQLVKGSVLKVANNQKREEREIILNHLGQLGVYSDQDLVTVAEFIYRCDKTS
jgi:hypothetical protein